MGGALGTGVLEVLMLIVARIEFTVTEGKMKGQNKGGGKPVKRKLVLSEGKKREKCIWRYYKGEN